MIRLLSSMLLLVPLLTACGDPKEHYPTTNTFDGVGPERFRGDLTATVRFSSKVTKDCVAIGAKEQPDTELRGCGLIRGEDVYLVLPNPCSPKPPVDSKLEIYCHELNHGNGWPPLHGP